MNPRVAPTMSPWADPAPQQQAAGGSLLDGALAAGTGAGGPRATDTARLERFLRETDPTRAALIWFDGVPDRWKGDLKQKMVQSLGRDIARLDALLTDQLNALLHHPEFQKLEAAWRGLWFLVDQVPEGA